MCSLHLISVYFFVIYLRICVSSQEVIGIDVTNNHCYKSTDDAKLIFAQVIHRHGDRNIGRLYPNDPYKDEVHWPEGFSQLTKEGKRQLFRFGEFARRRYDTLLGDRYSPKNVYIRSTDTDRTIMSAQAALAGLFPPKENDIWHENIAWHPIPVHVVPIDMDHIRSRSCPRYREELHKLIKQSPEVRRIHTEFADHFSLWSQKSGLNISSFMEVKKLHKTLFIEKVHNKSLPEWAEKAVEPNGPMEYITTYSLKFLTETPQLARLRIGFLMKEIFDRFDEKINRKLQPDRSFWMYSAHDSTIVNILNFLGLFEFHLPPFASSIHFELYESDDECVGHYIQVFYRKSNEEELSPLNIPNCGKKCRLDQFYKLYNELIPGDFDSECSLES